MADQPTPSPTAETPPDAKPRRKGGATFAAGCLVPMTGTWACGACGHELPLPAGAAFPACPGCGEPKVIYRRVE